MTIREQNDTKRCNSCLFWQQITPDNDNGFAADRNYEVTEAGDGLCRRLPPIGQRRDMPGDQTLGRMHSADAALWAQWPVTIGDLDWCGEYRPFEGEAAAIQRARIERYRRIDMPGPSQATPAIEEALR